MALGRDQVAYLGILLLAGAVLDHWLRRRALWGTLGPLLAGALGGVLVVTIPVMLTLLLAEASNRPAIDFAGAGKGSLHPALLLTAVVPNLFGADGPFSDYWGPPSPRWGPVDLYLARNMGVLYLGALPLAVLVVGFTRRLFWSGEIRFFAVAFVAVLLYALGRHTPAFSALFHLPGAEFFRRPADGTFFIGALGAVLAGYAVNRLATGTRALWGVPETTLLLAIFAAALALSLLKGTFALATWPLAKAALCWGVALAVLWVLAHGRMRLVGLAVVGVLVAADIAWNNGPNESTALPPHVYDVLRLESRNETVAALKERLDPDSLDRVELAGLGFHWPNASLVHRLHNTLGYNPVRLGLYSEATGAEDHVALPEQRKFSPLFPSYRSTLAELLGLRFIASGVPLENIDPVPRAGDLDLVARTQDGFIYENARVFPRVAFVTGVRRADFAEILRTGRWPEVDYGRTVLLESATDRDPSAGESSATVVSYRNAEILVDVLAPTAGHLVVRDPYHPWWSAEVDGSNVPVRQADVLFRAVPVETGRHRVRMVFRPLRGAWREAQQRWPVLLGSSAR
jgi:hypothetical protein